MFVSPSMSTDMFSLIWRHRAKKIEYLSLLAAAVERRYKYLKSLTLIETNES